MAFDRFSETGSVGRVDDDISVLDILTSRRKEDESKDCAEEEEEESGSLI